MIAQARALAEEMVALDPRWQTYFDMTDDAAALLWDLPDAAASDKIRWIGESYLQAAVEIAASIGATMRQRVEMRADHIRVEHGLPLPEGDFNFDALEDISDVPADNKVLVALGIVTVFNRHKDNPGRLIDAKARFNNHSAGIAPDEIPASLHRRMTQAVAAVNCL